MFVSVAGCGDGGEELVPPVDTGTDDTSAEVAVDTGTDPDTGAADTDTDTGVADTTVDTGVDAPTDSGSEVATDSGTIDAPPDSTDTGAPAIACGTAADCPDSASVCAPRACVSGLCTRELLPAGTATTLQVTGDCKRNTCDGVGGVVVVADTTDVPADPSECTAGACTGTTPSTAPKSAGAACMTGGTFCNGSGSCVECVGSATCPATDTECTVRTCVAGKCGTMNLADGTIAATQVPGDCKARLCDGAGGIKLVNVDTDVPNDSNPCTTDTCASGVPTFTPAADGTVCGTALACVAGACTGCVTKATCPGADTACKEVSCSPTGQCGFTPKMGGMVTDPTPGDCKKSVCAVDGEIVEQNDDTDKPMDDGKECTIPTCTSGVASQPPVTPGTRCNKLATADGYCKADGNCVACLDNTHCTATGECYSVACVSDACMNTAITTGVPVGSQTPNDCQENQCDGMGVKISVDKSDDRTADPNECKLAQCTGMPMSPSTGNAPKTKSCTLSAGGGGFCDGGGTCVQCNDSADCPMGSICTANTCSPSPCLNGVQDAGESGVDCGGTSLCGKCKKGFGCTMGSDCFSGNCISGTNVCAPDSLVISEVKSRGAGGGDDEYIELYNPTTTAIVLTNTWKIQGKAHDSVSGLYTTRYTGTGITVPALGYVVIGSIAGASAPLSSGITDSASLLLLEGSTLQDAVCYYRSVGTMGATTLPSFTAAFTCEGTYVNNAPHNDGTSSASNSNKVIARKPSHRDTNSSSDWVGNVNPSPFAPSP